MIYQRLMKHLDRYFWISLLILGGIFYARFTYNKLAPDDVMWYQGQAATVFDQYRVIPLACFRLLNVLFGPSVLAAQGMIFLFHTLNAVLVYHLSRSLLANEIAGRISAAVFFINPVTLGALTWISCFSYIIGTTFALGALLAFVQANAPNISRPYLWSITAVGCYTVGLFCSHELFLLPITFLLIGWLYSSRAAQRGLILSVISMLIAAPVYLFFYNFDRYGIESGNMLSLGFVSALVSSGLSLNVSLLVAYPFSFEIKTYDFLKACFSETTRWLLALVVLSAIAVSYRLNRRWRLLTVLVLMLGALSVPYVSRLYLMSGAINYHPSYMLGGRVFYIPFIAVSLLVGFFLYSLMSNPGFKLGLLVMAAAYYIHAMFFLYTPTDFMGLAVSKSPLSFAPPPWNPYADDHIMWLVGAGLGVMLLLIFYLLSHSKPKTTHPSTVET
ncbi:MAG TPA: hypothetical protein VHP83_03410 [Aggregatilineaceae bacterium]|nr:hypothetical protein [Aggregatilineaceae bacterium]